MPQFDIFSFSSQLFWVFFSFSLLYASLAYYLLPALAISLKVRKRKLLVSSSSSSSTSIIAEPNSGSVSSFEVSLDNSVSQKESFLSNASNSSNSSLTLDKFCSPLDVSIVEKTSLKYFVKKVSSHMFALSVS